MRLTIKTIAAVAVGALALTVTAAPTPAATASARQCFFNSGPDADALYASYRDEKVGVMSYVRPGGSMTCASARYVARRLVRQWNRNGRFARTWFDGYVTWHGRVIGRRSSGAQIIRFREYRSNTSITIDWQVTVF
jgi:hypothetical protein